MLDITFHSLSINENRLILIFAGRFFLETPCFRYLGLGLLRTSTESQFRKNFNELLTLSTVCVVFGIASGLLCRF
jgi:hypothetical protein